MKIMWVKSILLITDRLNYHCVDFVWREFELVARQTVCQTDSHRSNLFLGYLYQTVHLTTNQSHQILHIIVTHAIDVEFFLKKQTSFRIWHHKWIFNFFLKHLYWTSKFGVCHKQSLLCIVGNFLQQFFQRLGDFSLDRAGYGRQGNRCVVKFLKMLQLQALNYFIFLK